jgi:uncharacterized protein
VSMARLSKHFGLSAKRQGKSRLAPVIAGVGVLGLLGALFFVLLTTEDAHQANGHSTAYPTHGHTPDVHSRDAKPIATASVDEPEDNRLQVHTHHAEPLGEEAYKDAPPDVVLWGDLARALVVRRGSTYQTTFLPPVLALDGKTISIVGYVTPVTEKVTPSKQFLLSNHAFLCDECEPPTSTELVEVNTRDSVIAKEGVAIVRGQFEVVKNDSKGLAYRLNKAVILKQQAH